MSDPNFVAPKNPRNKNERQRASRCSDLFIHHNATPTPGGLRQEGAPAKERIRKRAQEEREERILDSQIPKIPSPPPLGGDGTASVHPVQVVRCGSSGAREDYENPSLDPSHPLQLLWSEKYRPQSTAQLVGNYKSVQGLIRWIQERRAGNTSVHFASLLQGPPGLGKTTSAVLALQEAGFGVFEINASDRRTRKVIYDDVLETVTKISPTGKRISIILDEIDGAVAKTSRDPDSDNTGVQGVLDFLLRCEKDPQKFRKVAPIVCICNDGSSPALRRLGKHCEVLRWYKPWKPSDLFPLMDYVAASEKMRVNAADRQRIAESANGDLRQVTNMLQMLASHCRAQSGEGRIRRALKFREFTSQTNADLFVPDVFTATRMVLSEPTMTLDALQQMLDIDGDLLPQMFQENAAPALKSIPSKHFSGADGDTGAITLFEDTEMADSRHRLTEKSVFCDLVQLYDNFSDADVLSSSMWNVDESESALVSGLATRVCFAKERPYFASGRTRKTSLQVSFPSGLSKSATIRSNVAQTRKALHHLVDGPQGFSYSMEDSVMAFRNLSSNQEASAGYEWLDENDTDWAEKVSKKQTKQISLLSSRGDQRSN